MRTRRRASRRKRPAGHIDALLQEGLARSGGGQPEGSARPARVEEASVADAVIEGLR